VRPALFRGLPSWNVPTGADPHEAHWIMGTDSDEFSFVTGSDVQIDGADTRI
jgi:hypothetical protein